MRALATGSVVIAAILLLSTPAFSQPAVAGTVKDSSGAILPGVNVEASSPVLIEKSRTVVTDGTGQYRIVDLKPGTYTVTFTLSGFATIKREAHRTDGRRRDDHQCRHAGRRRVRNGHRHRRDARRRHPDEHETRGRALQRGARRGPRLAHLRQHPGAGARRPVVDARRELHPVGDRDRHEFLLHVAGRTRRRKARSRSTA